VRLLFDANLSPGLIPLLADLYPNSVHVLFVGLGPSPADDQIWTFSGTGNDVVASKDADFYRLSTLFGAPPKVVWLRIGNGPTLVAEALLRRSHAQISAFVADPTAALLILGRRV
jgi:predicted nuclease of predicted toxin-antitoxin system